MTARIEKTVFISYRRTNLPWALFVYQNLTMHGYDVFFDYQSIDSGNFESVILDNIRARAHFIVILTPSALENCNKPGDWLRREIETAIDENRNIVPLMVESFDFGSPFVKEALTGKLATLSTYNGLPIPNAYALEAMERLRERYLNKALNNVSTPVLQEKAQEITENQKNAANELTPVQEKELTAQTWFERGYVFAVDSKNFKEAIRCFSEAIRLKPDDARAYYNRALAHQDVGDLDSAIDDHTQAIRLENRFAEAYTSRGIIYRIKGNLDHAITDHTQAIQIKPEYSEAYNNRGKAYLDQHNIESAIRDLSEAIRLKSDYATPYNNRGVAYALKGDPTRALDDFDDAIRINPNYANPYYNRASIWEERKNYANALVDYQKYLELDSGVVNADQKVVENKIKNLKNKLVKKKSAKKKLK